MPYSREGFEQQPLRHVIHDPFSGLRDQTLPAEEIERRAHIVKTAQDEGWHITPAQRREILRMSASGESVREIARATGRSRSTVGRIISSTKKKLAGEIA